ncbi:GNAT family N-acetyltransferase [Listeria kieliensis]|uniref:GCN5 family acetyltransferase n=1 Tax=Listeria kieliensis TaxID=1621700 RepID=A0A3D8TQV7_9LIST|nr:GNAT family N-acetyltransferase [Listeria kieliensis]RDX01268.1 GCN5 family acetyltransferase [Listeria kieliensis]
MILETERLYANEMTQADLPALASMLQDPEVMYAYEHDFSDADVRSWLENNLRRYRELGFGLWGIYLKENDQFIGNAGITYQEVENEMVLELGYLLKKIYWHKGYAREITAAIVQYAQDKLHAPEIHATIKTTNAASIRVAENNQMERTKAYIKFYYGIEMPHYLYTRKF